MAEIGKNEDWVEKLMTLRELLEEVMQLLTLKGVFTTIMMIFIINKHSFNWLFGLPAWSRGD